MLRSLACGWRDFKAAPDTLSVRYNWIFLCLFAGRLYPKFDPALLPVGGGTGHNFWVIPPHTRYVVTADTRRCERAVFHFSHVPEILQARAQRDGILALRLTPRQLTEVRALVTSIEHDYHHPTFLSEVRFEQVLLQLTLLALQPLDRMPLHPLHNLTRDRVEKALAWFTAHMAEGPSLAAVAAAVHVSPSHLRRHFYERLGRSPKAAFTRARMQRATALLIGTDLTLDAIAERCGFSTATDFGRAFKSEFHTTPNSWRRTVNSAEARARGRG
jgi:AraC-like DNA-binding protein